MKKIFVFFLIFTIIAMISCRKSNYYLENEIYITDNGGGTGTTTWTKEKNILLDGFVFVNDGQTLTIEPGTVIRSKPGQGSQASALIVSRGGKIIAQGTSDEPIIFTVEGDDLKGSVPFEARGLWGGLILLGNAPINTSSGEASVEGIPISEPRGIYGGYDAEDNSGILQYVSIRHGGTNIGENNEINGLTLGGVGRKTIIDHIEVISNADDGIEFFGGTVNCSNLAVGYCGDDAFDFDEGYTGKCQFLLGVVDDNGNHAAEHNGASVFTTGNETTQAIIYNATYLTTNKDKGTYLISFDSNSGGIYKNSVFLNNKQGVSIEINDMVNSYNRLLADDLLMSNNVFYNIGENNSDSIFRLFPVSGSIDNEADYVSGYFSLKNNVFEDNGIIIGDEEFFLLPANTIFSGMATYSSSWFEQVSFKGAFGSNNWLEGWTYLWAEGKID
jgi:hypothetical protein